MAFVRTYKNEKFAIYAHEVENYTAASNYSVGALGIPNDGYKWLKRVTCVVPSVNANVGAEYPVSCFLIVQSRPSGAFDPTYVRHVTEVPLRWSRENGYLGVHTLTRPYELKPAEELY